MSANPPCAAGSPCLWHDWQRASRTSCDAGAKARRGGRAGAGDFAGGGEVESPEPGVTAPVELSVGLGVLPSSGLGDVALPWSGVSCRAEGKLDRVERTTRFTEVVLHVELLVHADVDLAKAERVLEKAKTACLISSSLVCPVTLEKSVRRV